MRALIVMLLACSARGVPPSEKAPLTLTPASRDELLAPAAFDAIADRDERSRALFLEATRVFAHARCSNCHPADDVPRQGEAHEPHDPPVVRGAGGRGVPALQCNSCHQDRNAILARVPGAPDWHLAPVEMAWLGKSAAAICAQLSDRARNGNRSLAQVREHLARDALVAWGWAPGADRATPPGSQAQLAALFQAWIDSGAVCPREEDGP